MSEAMGLVPVADSASIRLHHEAIARLEQAENALVRAVSVEDVKDLRDKAAAIAVYSRERDLGLEIQNKASSLKLKSEHKLGTLLHEMPKHEGGRPAETGSHCEPVSAPLTLASLGIKKTAAATYQKIASLPVSVIDEKVKDALSRGDVVSQRDIVIEANKRNRPKPKPAPSLPSGVFEVIYADPPWKYDSCIVADWAVENHYGTLLPEQIIDLTVHGEQIAAKFAPDAILFMWVGAPKIREGLWVMSQWGFEYKTSAFWIKNNPEAGQGFYFTIDHELLLVGSRGNWSPPPRERRGSSLIEEKRGRHSAKPRSAREMIEAMYPDAQRLELFAREVSPGWTAWGNEA